MLLDNFSFLWLILGNMSTFEFTINLIVKIMKGIKMKRMKNIYSVGAVVVTWRQYMGWLEL